MEQLNVIDFKDDHIQSTLF